MMKNALTKLYPLLLRLYPKTFREEYGEEMLDVFRMKLEDEFSLAGRFSVLVEELMDLPFSVMTIFWQYRRNMMKNSKLIQWLNAKQGSVREIMLAALPMFLLTIFPGFLITFPSIEDALSNTIGRIILVLIFGCLAVLGILGLFAGMPRWAWYYAGLMLNLLTFMATAVIGFSGLGPLVLGADWLPGTLLFFGLYALLIILIGFAGTWLAAKIKPLRGFFLQIKEDWSLLTLLMFGGAHITVMMAYEDLANSGIQQMITGVIILAALFLFFRARSKMARLIILLTGFSAAAVVAGWANIVLNPFPEQMVLNIAGLEIIRSIVVLIITWLTSGVLMALTALFPMIANHKMFAEPEEEILAQS